MNKSISGAYVWYSTLNNVSTDYLVPAKDVALCNKLSRFMQVI